jgi:prepilin-type N-terminal cleavage/methylation domain-containing protein
MRRGLTLLEVMVALVILGIVVVGFLEVFQGSTRLAHDSEAWATAVTYAEDAMEVAKLDGPRASRDVLPGGFERSVETRMWRDGITLVTVRVSLPGGGRVALDRLVETR